MQICMRPLWCVRSLLKEHLGLFTQEGLSVSRIHKWSIIVNWTVWSGNYLVSWLALVTFETDIIHSISDEYVGVRVVVKNTLHPRVETSIGWPDIESGLMRVLHECCVLVIIKGLDSGLVMLLRVLTAKTGWVRTCKRFPNALHMECALDFSHLISIVTRWFFIVLTTYWQSLFLWIFCLLLLNLVFILLDLLLLDILEDLGRKKRLSMNLSALYIIAGLGLIVYISSLPRSLF